MLLRRIKHHIVNENWFAVFVDFVIVVVGVYVGIEVSNWNEARQEDLRAQQYLERIGGDLSTDLELAGYRARFWADVLAYGDKALRYAEHGELAAGSSWQTVLAFYQASQIWAYTSIDMTYQELKSAGELRLIDDDVLRAELGAYYITGVGLETSHLFNILPEYRETVRGLTPWHVQTHIWAHCHRTSTLSQELVDCESPIDTGEADAILAIYLADERLVRELRFWMTNLSVAKNVLEANRARVERLIALVDASRSTTGS
jgi:hypothetical protein